MRLFSPLFQHRWRIAWILWIGMMLPLSGQAATDFLVDADWLVKEQSDNPKLVIIEVRYHPHRYQTVGHIPGAIQAHRFTDLGDPQAKPIMRFPSRELFQQTLRRWGVDNDSTLVLYDDSSTALVARLYLLLDLFGYEMSRVKILNGGAVGWSGLNELTTQPTAPPPLGRVTLQEIPPQRVAEWPEIYRRIVAERDPQSVLIDARPSPMYSGEVVRHAIQGGHIPGAINIVSLDGVVGSSQTWKSEAELAALYQAVPKEKTIYLYCHDGFRMSLGWLQLKSLGYTDIRLLNGGWSAWDGALTLPVVRGHEPYDTEFAL